ncbi:MAG: CsgG/HfaB family protein [Saprospiraceae bacterium]
MKIFLLITKSIIPIFIIVLFFSSCGAYLNQPSKIQGARNGEFTPMTSSLKSLPKTSKPVVVAVYNFRDQTGQYKPSENGSNWSTAVTQGATTILMKTLEESKWFKPLERENISNLLNERKILKNSQSQRDGRKDQPLPPLYYAGIIIEGGIISYDSNILTGGAGARYFGAGGSAQYRQDRITIYLRVVSTKTGEVIKTIHTSKTILSQKVDVGLFRFVSFQKLLEVETGFTYNEPIELAVTEAIEKAVYNLVMEGIIDKFLKADDIPDVDKDKRVIMYKAEKSKFEKIDLLGREQQEYRTPFWLTGSLVTSRLRGDLVNPLIRPGVEVGFGSTIKGRFGWQTILGFNNFAARKFYDSNYYHGELNLHYRILPKDRLSPNIEIGGGVLINTLTKNSYFLAKIGSNLEYSFTKKVAVKVGFQYHHLFKDNIESIENGKYNDYILKGTLGLNFYF